ncbi:uncharacterized protein [Trachinotus anak]|uniref:uncharacterized protein n=1 Tax=Trachinotus anak TaxID=443729 RepID=UPI0039F1E994
MNSRLKWINLKMLITFCIALVFTLGRCRADQNFLTKTVHVGEDVTLTCSRQGSKMDAGTLFWIFSHFPGPEPDITAIIQVPPSDPVRPGDSVTLQCSVLFDSEKKTCPGDHSVYWFRAGADESQPSLIYAHGNSGDQCEESPEAQSTQKCVYNFSKNVSSSDAGTHYCAVATCGEILFGNGMKLGIEAANMGSFGNSQKAVFLLLFTALALSFIVTALLIYIIKKNKYTCFNDSSAAMQTNAATTVSHQQSHKTDGDSLVYSVPRFTRKAGRRLRSDGKAVEGENALISVTTVQLGEPVTFTCSYPQSEHSNIRVKWYKQSTGDTLTLIISLMKSTANPTFEDGFPPSRFHVNHTTTASALTILSAVQEDEALYHCAVTTWNKDQWSGMYLSLKENSQRMSDYTVVQLPTVPDPVHPGASVTLQCSVLSHSEKNSCPGDHSVHWFGVSSDKSLPNIIYADGNRPDECDKKPDERSPTKSCVYRFSKTVSSSDAGTYYCAVVTCGEILFGNGTKVEIEGSGLWSFGVLQQDNISLLLLFAILAISLVVIAFLIYTIKKSKCDYCNATVSLQENIAKRNFKRREDRWVYSAVVFTMMKTCSDEMRDAKVEGRERIYAAVKAFGLD